MNALSLENTLLILAPAALLGLVVYYLIHRYFQNEEMKLRYTNLQLKNKEMLPLRLQAYERMTLYLERIVPSKLISRELPKSAKPELYFQQLTEQIEKEFEHNLAQQIYMSDACWNLIKTAKNTTINQLRNTLNDDGKIAGDDIRELMLYKISDKEPPSYVAIRFLKEEVMMLLK